MAHYIVYWLQDWVQELKKAEDMGPIKVVFGSIHSRMPSIVSIKVGDVVFPVTLIKKKLYVMARLPVTHRERAFDYCMRELGRWTRRVNSGGDCGKGRKGGVLLDTGAKLSLCGRHPRRNDADGGIGQTPYKAPGTL